MFKPYHLMILDDGEMVDSITKIAANHGLQCLYKIGVYGKERQHELYIIGNLLNYWRFLRKLNREKLDEIEG